MTNARRPLGMTLLTAFFIFGATMSGLSAVMLVFPGSPLDALWNLNPRAHRDLGQLGLWAVVLMSCVSIACATATLGLLRLKRWGYSVALSILIINVAADTGNAVITHDWRTLIGLPIGVWMIWYLASRRALFNK